MDEQTLINQVWDELRQRSVADRTTSSYNLWIKINGERDKTLLTVNRVMLAEAMQRILVTSDVSEFLALLRKIDENRHRRAIEGAMITPEIEERTGEW